MERHVLNTGWSAKRPASRSAFIYCLNRRNTAYQDLTLLNTDKLCLAQPIPIQIASAFNILPQSPYHS